jgi:hypothetical protein
MQAPTFGLKPALQLTTVETLRRMWAIADDGGFDGCWVIDHFAALGPDRTGDVFEAWTTLAAMAEATSRVRIGSMVTGNSHRNPGMLAKMAVTVDHLSGGRLDMGIGAGGDEMVHDMFGVPLGSIRERIESLAEPARSSSCSGRSRPRPSTWRSPALLWRVTGRMRTVPSEVIGWWKELARPWPSRCAARSCAFVP